MTGPLVLALDAMGGDHAPEIVIRGANLARERFPEARFLLIGDERKLKPLVDRASRLRKVATIEHTDETVAADAKPSVALRMGRRSSMRLAIDAVGEGRASAAVSAGNTGALMAMAKIALRTLPGIHRPAIASIFPTRRGESVMLDLGANIECDAENLVQFAVMGDIFARAALGALSPSIGLLNVGSEDQKGRDAIREAARMLRHSPLSDQFQGFVEGDDIPAGSVDIIVTDGFTGNVALKTAEGTAQLFSFFLRQSFRHSLLARLGYLVLRPAIVKFRDRVDPRRYNGAMFLGLNGIVVKSHGGTDALGFANAIGVAVDMAKHGYLERMATDLARVMARAEDKAGDGHIGDGLPRSEAPRRAEVG